MGDEAISRAPNALHAVVEHETVVLDPATGRYTRLNASGTFLWDLLAEPTTPAALGDRLARAYGIDAATAREHVDSFVRSLDESGLLAVPDRG